MSLSLSLFFSMSLCLSLLFALIVISYVLSSVPFSFSLPLSLLALSCATVGSSYGQSPVPLGNAHCFILTCRFIREFSLFIIFSLYLTILLIFI